MILTASLLLFEQLLLGSNPDWSTTLPLAAFLPLDSLFSTQGVMVMLLVAYAGAMWMFLSSAPKVYTIMVSDLEVAKQFYQGELQLSLAEVPLHYYYNYEQTLGTIPSTCRWG
jgi:hypothetical protein